MEDTKREDNVSPTVKDKKKPRSSQEQELDPIVKQVDGLRMAVIDRHHLKVTLNLGQADLIQKRLVQEMDNSTSESPQFKLTSFGNPTDELRK